MKKVIFVVLVAVGLSSCKMYRTLTFNEDGSGKMENVIDMTQMMSLMGDNESMGMGDMSSLMGGDEMSKISEKLLEIDGISNVTTSFDTNGIITSTYEFKDIESLNRSLTNSSTSSMLMGMDATGEEKGGSAKIKFKGKKFTWEEIDKNGLKKLNSDEGKSQMKEAEMMLGSSEIITTINFPRKIRSTSYKDAAIINDASSVTYSRKMNEFITPKYKPLVVKLK